MLLRDHFLTVLSLHELWGCFCLVFSFLGWSQVLVCYCRIYPSRPVYV